MKLLCCIGTCGALLVTGSPSVAGTNVLRQVCSVMDVTGNQVSGGGIHGVYAAGQGGSVAQAEGGGVTHYAGFLGCFLLSSALDTDQDGLVDELDGDNDGDGLTDLAEASGSGFSPQTVTDLNATDSDHDGMTDGEESVARTNPLDPGSLLAITGITLGSGPTAKLTWKARDGMNYNIYRTEDLTDPGASTYVTTVSAAGGTAPWYETSASTDVDAATSTNAMFSVEIAP